MAENKKKISKLFYIFIFAHLVLWTVVPSLVNVNLPLDTIEALAWGSNLEWGFNKHPPVSAFFPQVFFMIFGSQDWAYYFLSQIFVVTSFYFVFKLSNEMTNNIRLSLISVLLLEGIYFYNFTTPEYNVNIAQLPFWSITVYLAWKIFDKKDPDVINLILLGIFAAVGFLSKYLFLYLLISIDLLFFYFIFIKKYFKFKFSYLISLEVFLLLLIPHFIWLIDNDFVTITYGLSRTGNEEFQIINHIKYPVLFILKQIGILVPFFILCLFLIKKFKFRFTLKDKKTAFLFFVNIVPVCLVLITSILLGSKIRTMWMTPFYLFNGVLIVYLFKKQIDIKRINNFLYCFLFLFLFSPFVYGYISLSNDNKRTDYPGKQIAEKVQLEWNKNFDEPIEFVIGDEWKAGNLSYHIKSRPKWEGFLGNNEILNEAKEYICIDDICVGTYK